MTQFTIMPFNITYKFMVKLIYFPPRNILRIFITFFIIYSNVIFGYVLVHMSFVRVCGRKNN